MRSALPLLREPTTPERETNQAEEEIMKVQIIPYFPPPPPRDVVITLSEPEAVRLLLATVTRDDEGNVLSHLREKLLQAGVQKS